MTDTERSWGHPRDSPNPPNAGASFSRGSGTAAFAASHVYGRQDVRHDGGDIRGVSGCGLPEMHRALLPQRILQGPQVQAPSGRRDAQGGPCPGTLRRQHGKAEAVASSLEGMKLKEAAKCVRDGVAETLTCTRFPMRH